MKRFIVVVGAPVAVLVALALALAIRHRAAEENTRHPAASAPPILPTISETTATHSGFLYGRVTADDGTIYEGRMRWGGDEEAFWGDAFNGVKKDNPWAVHVSPELLSEKRPIAVFGFELAKRAHRADLERPFMTRFGDIVRIASAGRDLRVTLKSGTMFHLDRLANDDLADGLRIWDTTRGVVDLDERHIRVVEHLANTEAGAAPGARLHGTVQTKQGPFTGFLQWDRQSNLGTDELEGRAGDSKVRLRFDGIRAIARESADSARITNLDGSEMVLSGTRDAGEGNRGVYVDDPRYGRVLVSWDAFERVDFAAAQDSPIFHDFPPGEPLTGSVTTRDGRKLVGRLVYDLDESETTETLDAPSRGVQYTIPFGRIASIELPGVDEERDRPTQVTLHDGETLQLERKGDLGEQHGGMLIFVDGAADAAYVRWRDVERIALEHSTTKAP